MKRVARAPSPPGVTPAAAGAPRWIDPPTVLGNMVDLPSTAPSTTHDGPMLGSLHVLPEGARLLDYEIVGLIGEGGFGIVYLAYDASLERHVAIKEYLPAVLASRASSRAVMVKSERHADAFRTGLRSFVNEARLLARFDHPSLVKVLRFWEGNGTAYMVMPFYEGPTLAHALQSLGRAPTEQELLGWLRPLLHALSTLHAVRCYHRDIAPDNILLTPTGPLLLDFGAARRVVGQSVATPTVVIKPGYAPIEQYGEAPTLKQGPWTDVYALAGVVYAAIAGQPPVPAVERWIDDHLTPLSQIARGQYSEHFLAAVDSALALRPGDRPESAAAFWAQLSGPAGKAMPLAGAAPAAFALPPDVDMSEAAQQGAAEGDPAVVVASSVVFASPTDAEAEVWGETELLPYEGLEATPARDVDLLSKLAPVHDAAPAPDATLDVPPDPPLSLHTGAVADLPEARTEEGIAPAVPPPLPPSVPSWAAPPSLGTVAQPWETRRRRWRYVLLALLLAALLAGGWAFNALRSGSIPPVTAPPPAVLPPPREALPKPAPAAVPSSTPRAAPEAPKVGAAPAAVAATPPVALPPPPPQSPPITAKPAANPAPAADVPRTAAVPKAPLAPPRPTAAVPVPVPVPAVREVPAPVPAATAETRRRCTDILQRASIEPLRPAELAFLKRECR
ncbi:serine/threonine-protein kinase [Variovorax arabinosiphilus]|uniref:serine/threonine-protein kinase n=1 Tax=Variovorax arabinosiphilus TaxID=3053498 RepID=UPI0025786F91|nr:MULTISPECIES: serine/threonine-protein kinase [unclassified Variovorax]MDM0122227.1 serine/threonine-protein kinase [Variovorax sp. J2L1-78]MDM0234990.1 serine/threonine-protein kinase [Variovorax sp. J2R1-6]